MKLFPVRTQAPRLPALVLVCLLLVLGAVLGFAVCRAVPQQDRQELSDYLHQYAQATADGRGPSASALSVAAAYFRYPLAAALLGLAAAGLVLLPVLSVAQGFFLSFSVGCFARALGRGGVYLALAAFGPRCLLVLGAVLGFAVCRAVPQQDRQELSDYLHQYAQATADGRGPSASALSVAAAYFRYPLAAALLGLAAAGLVLLPVLSVAQGFFLSFSVGCFARALGRGGVYLALAAFGPRCLFVLPCTLLLTVQGLSAAARRRDGQKVRLTEGAYWRRVGLCGLILLIGAALELTFGPRLLQWVITRTL